MITTVGNKPLKVWLDWVNGVLTSPLKENLNRSPEVVTVLQAFKELIMKVEYQQKKEEQKQIEKLVLQYMSE